MKTQFIAAAIVLCAAGCARQPPSDQASAPATVAASVASVSPRSAGQISIPTRYALKSNGRAEAAANWSTYLAQLSREDRNYLEDFNASYAGVLEFDSPEALQRMADLGIPLPSEVLASRSLTDAELKAFADSGNVKARMLYVDRQIDNARAAAASGTTEGPDEVNRPALNAILAALEVAQADDGPFGAYLAGRASYELGIDHAPEYMAGALIAAEQRGDERAAALFDNFAEKFPEMRASSVQNVARSMDLRRKR